MEIKKVNIIPFIEKKSNDYEYKAINKDDNNKQYTSKKKKYLSDILFLITIIFVLILSFYKQQIFKTEKIDVEKENITNIPQIDKINDEKKNITNIYKF